MDKWIAPGPLKLIHVVGWLYQVAELNSPTPMQSCPWAGYVARPGCCRFLGGVSENSALPWKDKVNCPAPGSNLTTSSRVVPMATALVPQPCQSQVLRESKERKMSIEGEENLIYTITAVGLLWSGWFIQGSPDRSGPQPHLASSHSPPPTPASWVPCSTWPAC